jgi:hypothetical protein
MDNVQDKTATTKDLFKPPFPVVPTTKVLAIGQFMRAPTPEQLKEIFPKEVPARFACIWLARSTNGGFARRRQVPCSS